MGHFSYKTLLLLWELSNFNIQNVIHHSLRSHFCGKCNLNIFMQMLYAINSKYATLLNRQGKNEWKNFCIISLSMSACIVTSILIFLRNISSCVFLSSAFFLNSPSAFFVSLIKDQTSDILTDTRNITENVLILCIV